MTNKKTLAGKVLSYFEKHDPQKYLLWAFGLWILIRVFASMVGIAP